VLRNNNIKIIKTMKKMTIVDLYKSGKRILIRNDHEYKQVMHIFSQNRWHWGGGQSPFRFKPGLREYAIEFIETAFGIRFEVSVKQGNEMSAADFVKLFTPATEVKSQREDLLELMFKRRIYFTIDSRETFLKYLKIFEKLGWTWCPGDKKLPTSFIANMSKGLGYPTHIHVIHCATGLSFDFGRENPGQERDLAWLKDKLGIKEPKKEKKN
jgi:hypothetical protein